MRSYILNEEGVPVLAESMEQWALWYQKADRRVKQTWVGRVRVSTVFLGLDYNFYGGAPLLYETLVFGGEKDGEMRRYATREEALRGHDEVVKEVEGG